MHAGRVRTNVPRALRTLRHRRRWRQEDLGRRAGLSRDVVHRAEAGELRGITVGSLGRLTEALDAQLVVEIRWRGAELDRLVDADHARIVSAGAQRLERSGWIVRTEVSFNHFGDRGRCDLVAWHAGTRTLVIVEVKSRIGDLQETLGRLDVKARLGSVIADQLAWGRPSAIVAALVLDEQATNRRVLREHEAQFSRFGLRGRAALAWLRRPHPTAGMNGLLWFESPHSGQGRTDNSDRLSRSRRAG
jgi:transcriptional regulator with XRE-family HTH domain